MRTAKFTPTDVAKILEWLAQGWTVRNVAIETKSSPVTIQKIKNGEYVPNTRENARNAIPLSHQFSLSLDPVDSGSGVGQA